MRKFENLGNLALLLFALLIFCSREQSEQTSDEPGEVFPNQEAWNSTVTSTVDGRLNAVIHYGHMKRFKQRKVVDFDEGIEIDFYNEKGEHTSKLTSERGRLNEATSDIEAFGNVVVVSDSGINLQTEHLFWDNSIEKVVSDTFVTITTTEQDTFYGIGFESDQYLNNWVIRRISGKTSKGLELDLELKKSKKTAADSAALDSAAIKPKVLEDSTKLE